MISRNGDEDKTGQVLYHQVGCEDYFTTTVTIILV